MTDAARSNGNAEQLITVGQDEAGLGDSPNIQFFAREINFFFAPGGPTTISFGTVFWRTPSKAGLMEETGVMF